MSAAASLLGLLDRVVLEAVRLNDGLVGKKNQKIYCALKGSSRLLF